ncbi:hypothetical protein [Persicobacter psychrovividus]|uniref:FkbM family methyltransferase n=1 Tax=Persicobacter psychrovividus TaxID=387638 RepID=A0ABN6LJ70_9BACT|nr:hypothetical protein PEPS_37770 [Persicobacter psychrovividus]
MEQAYSFSTTIKKLFRRGQITYLEGIQLVRFASKLGWFSRRKSSKVISFQYLGFKFYALNLQEVKRLFYRIFSSEEFWLPVNSTNPIIVDLEAGEGLAVLFYKWRFPAAQIIAFESDFKLYQLLRRNIESNQLTDITLYYGKALDYEGYTAINGDVSNRVACYKLSAVLPADKIDVFHLPLNQQSQIVLQELDAADKMSSVEYLLIDFSKYSFDMNTYRNFFDTVSSLGWKVVRESVFGSLALVEDRNFFLYPISVSLRQRFFKKWWGKPLIKLK